MGADLSWATQLLVPGLCLQGEQLEKRRQSLQFMPEEVVASGSTGSHNTKPATLSLWLGFMLPDFPEVPINF